MIVSEIMSRAIVINENLPIKEVAKIMTERGIGSIIVVKNDQIEGIITERDIVRNMSKKSAKAFDIMSTNVTTINEKESIDNAALFMADRKVKRLPVLSNGKLVGIVTSSDIIENSDEINEDFFFD